MVSGKTLVVAQRLEQVTIPFLASIYSHTEIDTQQYCSFGLQFVCTNVCVMFLPLRFGSAHLGKLQQFLS